MTIQHLIHLEELRQAESIELIASENYQSPEVLEAQASVFANKYAEGYPGRRYYGGQANTDMLETLCIQRAKELFHADHANVQALSGAAANVGIYSALLQPGDTILAMSLGHGGHLTHGSPVTFLSKVFNFVHYETDETGRVDMEQVRTRAHEHKPKMIVAGFSSYPRNLDYKTFSQIAQEVDAIAFADMSHIGGMIAAGLIDNPLDHGFHVMMTTTHKSLRGPRGALILSKGVVSNPLKAVPQTKENIPTLIDRGIFPGLQGGPHMNTIAAIALALEEAQRPDFKIYAQNILNNAQAMASAFIDLGYTLVTGGTDNHLIVIDLRPLGMDGEVAQKALDEVGISVSKSPIPHDNAPAYKPSGLRLGTPAMTTRGATSSDFRAIAELIDNTLKKKNNPDVIKEEVKQLARKLEVSR